MADISKITLPSGITYDIKDTWARNAIEGFSGGNIIHFGGATNTDLSNNGTEKPVDSNGIEHTLTAENKGELWFQGTQEFLWDGIKWIELGVVDALGSLAYKSMVRYQKTTGASLDNNPGFTGTGVRLTLEDYTPAGSVGQPTFSGNSLTSTGSYTPAGTISTVTNTTANKATTVSSTTGTATYTPAGTISVPTFSGTAATITVKGTPSGIVTATTSEKTTTVSPASSGTATYTPAGSVSTPTISVATAGSTTTIKNPTSVTVTKTIATATPGATSPDNAITYYDVSNETLRLYQLGYTTGASITTADVTVKTGDAAYSSTQPTFSGTGVRLVTGSITTPDSYSFSGNQLSSTGSYTPAGTIGAQTFSGTGVRLVTGDIPVPDSYTSTFSGTADTISVTGTPSGTVSKPSWTGTKASGLTVSPANSGAATYTPSGSVSKPNITLGYTDTNVILPPNTNKTFE